MPGEARPITNEQATLDVGAWQAGYPSGDVWRQCDPEDAQGYLDSHLIGSSVTGTEVSIDVNVPAQQVSEGGVVGEEKEK